MGSQNSNSKDKPAPSITSLLSTAAPRLDYLRIPIADANAWTSGLLDYEAGWLLNLIFSSAAAEVQGYLPNSSNLWQFAGARRADFFESYKSGVLARFKSREVDGIEMLYFPPLLEIIHRQSAALGKWRARNTHSLTGVDLKNQNQNQNQSECEKPRAKKTEAVKNAGDARRTTPLDRLIGG